MSVTNEAGGIQILRALQGYAAALVEEFGEPTFKGAYRYKGNAYAHFSRADMRVPGLTAGAQVEQ
jgi:hypothetical protein